MEEFTEDIDSKRMSERIEKLSTLLRKYLPQDYIRQVRSLSMSWVKKMISFTFLLKRCTTIEL